MKSMGQMISLRCPTCFQNPNSCFDLDFIAKKNVFLRTGSSNKRSEFLFAEKIIRGSVQHRLVEKKLILS